MKLSRESWLSIGLFSLLIVVTVAAAWQQTRDAYPPLVSTSPLPNGTLALSRWVEKMGYRLAPQDSALFAIPQRTDIVLMLEPFGLSDNESAVLDNWVEQGGTLIIAGESPDSLTLAAHYGFSSVLLQSMVEQIALSNPLLANPAFAEPITLNSYLALAPKERDSVVLLAAGEYPLFATRSFGKGRVIIGTSAYPFTNIGIQSNGNAAFVLNLLALAPKKGQVWFDEWHHGLRDDRSRLRGPEDWLRYTPSGRAVLFVALAIFLAILLQGQGFGRPVPLQRELKRRGPMEHVSALANLSRRAGHRRAVLANYHQQIKRHLGRRYRLDPSLPDDAYVAALVKYNPAIDSASLLNLLHRLSASNITETDLLHLAREAAQWVREKE